MRRQTGSGLSSVGHVARAQWHGSSSEFRTIIQRRRPAVANAERSLPLTIGQRELIAPGRRRVHWQGLPGVPDRDAEQLPPGLILSAGATAAEFSRRTAQFPDVPVETPPPADMPPMPLMSMDSLANDAETIYTMRN